MLHSLPRLSIPVRRSLSPAGNTEGHPGLLPHTDSCRFNLPLLEYIQRSDVPTQPRYSSQMLQEVYPLV